LRVLYEGGNEHEAMGVHFILSGKTLKLIEEERPLDNLIYTIYAKGGSFSRLDIAIDINKNYTQYFIDKIKKDEYTTKVDIDKNFYLIAGKNTKESINIGKRGSTKFLRIYNKQAEQQTTFLWTRWEIEIKSNEEITKVLNYINEKKINKYLLSYFRIVQKKLIGHSERELLDLKYAEFFDNIIPIQYEYELKKENGFIKWVIQTVLRIMKEIVLKMDKQEFEQMIEDIDLTTYNDKFFQDKIRYNYGSLIIGKKEYKINKEELT